MALDQLLSLSQTLKLSPTLLQSMQILQMNTQDLAEHLKELALENPIMEYSEDRTGLDSWEAFAGQVPWLRDAPAPTFGGKIPPDLGSTEAKTDSLSLLLGEQLDRLSLSPPLPALCRHLTEQLDDRGYLDEADLSDLKQAGVPGWLLERAVAVLQSLEPAGVAARSVGECLAIQAERREHALAAAICRNHLELLAAGNFKALAAKLSVSEAKVREAAALIRTLDPNPVGDLAPAERAEYIHPDAWVAEIDGKLRVFVNQWDLPQFHLSETYLGMLRAGPDSEAADYLHQKVQQAQWVLQCVRRRQDTLEACLTALVQAQEAFFLGTADAPGPLLRREIAQKLQVHPSTVTRTLKHKYIQCKQGLYPAGYFFSRSVGPTEGLWSEQAVKARLLHLIREEDPAHPLSDQQLTDRLAKEGISVARRTVVKYRTALGLPNSRLRRGKN